MIEVCHFNLATVGMGVKQKNDLWDYCQKYKINLQQFDEMDVGSEQYEIIEDLQKELDELQFEHRKLERKTNELTREVDDVLNSLGSVNDSINQKLKEFLKDVEKLDFVGKDEFVIKLKEWQKTTKYLETMIEDIDTDF